MSKKNNTPEQKAAWKANQKLGSRFIVCIPPDAYRPESKPPSKRDLHRAEVAARRSAQTRPGKPQVELVGLTFYVPLRPVSSLAQLGRRIPRMSRKATQILMKGRRGGETLTDTLVQFYRGQVAGARLMAERLAEEIKFRNISGKPFRDARPLKIQRSLSRTFPTAAEMGVAA